MLEWNEREQTRLMPLNWVRCDILSGSEEKGKEAQEKRQVWEAPNIMIAVKVKEKKGGRGGSDMARMGKER